MKVITDEKTRSIKPLGRLDTNSSNDLELALSEFTDNHQDIIIDLSECPYLSSAGIRILLKTKKMLLSVHAELYLTGIVPEVFQVLETAGLNKMFRFEANVETAFAKIQSTRKRMIETFEFEIDGSHLIYQSSGNDITAARLWKTPDIISYHELGFAIGFGSLAETGITVSNQTDLFVTAENCCGFLPVSQNMDADFRITSDPKKAGIFVHEALSFGHRPAGLLKLSKPDNLTISQLSKVIQQLKKEISSDASFVLLVVASLEKDSPSITVAVCNTPALQKITKEAELPHFEQLVLKNNDKIELFGLKFSLDRLDVSTMDLSLQEIIQKHLTFENILAVEPVNQQLSFTNPYVWLFLSNELTDGPKLRLEIETKTGLVFESHKAFLARQLYTDSSKLFIEQLHGGYSAQTFHVTSFDHDGRKMRPTVLKIAHRDLILREAERCKQYALPYIFNNSAVVLGAEYYGETGALRYNFVGIGGEASQLKWLTNYYLQSDLATLEPLFDKIFLQILKPWYGQPVLSTIAPYKDHDPTFTFFPHIYQTVSELFSISSDEQFIDVPEMGRMMINPYWFLKHEYARRRQSTISYHTGICHGDLNMQNILLDENMNVYLIDFSETRPRSIVSDFARLEAIFMIDNSPVENETDMIEYLNFMTKFYDVKNLVALPEISYHGAHQDKIRKNAGLILKMRQYAYSSSLQNPDILPYYLALLEWTLPIVCYTLPYYQKRLSMIAASLLCEQLLIEPA
ncbi:MAG: STAS domain-containing protein [Bacteroidales bacterium]|nr:STAS domain-containing protein [Bacteroidales bacterium]